MEAIFVTTVVEPLSTCFVLGYDIKIFKNFDNFEFYGLT